MASILHYISQTFSYIGPFFLLLGLLIFVHELGHFLVAKYFGVRVEVFSLGFGKKILQKKWGDTVYCLSLIPLGGYVKMYGDDPSADVPEDQRKYAFLHKPVWPRIAIVLAGPLMNLFFAIVLFSVIGGLGEEMAAPVLGDLNAKSKAYESGFRAGDKILKVQDQNITTWNEARTIIEANGGKPLNFIVERLEAPGKTAQLPIEATPTFGENENIFSTQKQVGQIDGLVIEAKATLLGISDPNSLASKSGFQTLDMIVSINGKKTNAWRDLNKVISSELAANQKELIFELKNLDAKDEDAPRKVTVSFPADWTANDNFTEKLGIETGELFIYKVKPDSPAGKAGMIAKDKVVKVNGQSIANWNDVIEQVKTYDPAGKPLTMTVVRDGTEKEFELRPEMTPLMNLKGQEEKRFTVGIVSGNLQVISDTTFYRQNSLGGIIKHGLTQTAQWTGFVVMSLVRLVEGEVSAKNIGGVITIGRVASHSYSAGLSAFLKTMAIISINLFLLNLLPVPILDGGHLVFFSIEALRGAPLSMRKMEIAQQVGLMLLMFLMVFAFFNDISNLLSAQW